MRMVMAIQVMRRKECKQEGNEFCSIKNWIMRIVILIICG